MLSDHHKMVLSKAESTLSASVKIRILIMKSPLVQNNEPIFQTFDYCHMNLEILLIRFRVIDGLNLKFCLPFKRSVAIMSPLMLLESFFAIE